MVGSSKILTVSYGTFSCTLEGFDESFETMKAIAEYFRDLAADDRYFGAEPPTPDADMLARIAEREIARRVEAHEHEGRIVLRAQDNAGAGRALAPVSAAAPAATPAPDTAAPGETPPPEAGAAPGAFAPLETGTASETGADAGHSPTADADTAPHGTSLPEEETAPEGGAQTPQEPVSAQAPAPEMDAVPDDAVPDDVADALDVADMPGAATRAEEAAPRDAAAPDRAGQEQEQEEPLAEPTDEETTQPLLHEADEPEAAPLTPAADDLSARLDLIRSVVGASDSYDEDEHAQDFHAQDFEDGTGPEAIAWDTPEAGDAADDAPADDAPAPEPLATRPKTPERAEPPSEPSPTKDDSPFEDTLAALLADAAPVGVQAAQAPRPSVEETQPADAVADEADAADANAANDAAAPAEAEDRPNARVVKVSRADVEAARAGGLLEAGVEAGEDTVNIFGDEADALSPEDEAELQRELASLDVELGDEIGPDDAPEAGADSPAPEPEQAAAQPEGGKRTEVSRIFDETDTHMADPGSVRRRNTIQHLRAALAATRAEKAAGRALGKNVDATPYRGDLDAAVRPRRAIPAPDGPRASRPEDARPAPLKLVAEQRVDKPRAKVRPRRVTTPPVSEVIEQKDKEFATFAEELGATDLPDLLEAAAAYLADIEGRSQFSRPMLMGKLREIDEEGFSREDGLRSFGQLLREGKLQKLSGGRFAVTEETEFRAAAQRRAG